MAGFVRSVDRLQDFAFKGTENACVHLPMRGSGRRKGRGGGGRAGLEIGYRAN